MRTEEKALEEILKDINLSDEEFFAKFGTDRKEDSQRN